MGPKGSERAVGRSLEHGNFGVFFVDARNRLFDIIDIDAEVVESRHIARLSADDGNADVTVANADRVIVSNRFFFLCGARLGPLHAEDRLVKLRLAHEVFADDSGVLDSGEHSCRLLRRLRSKFNVQGSR